VTTMASLGWRRALCAGLLVTLGAVPYLLSSGSVDSEFPILLLGTLFGAWGLALGSHLIVRDLLPPPPRHLIGGTFLGTLTGAAMCIAGLVVGAALADLFSLRRSEGVEWAIFLLPPWIASSGGSAIFARYLVWLMLGDQMVVVAAAGAVGALVGDSLMLFLVIRPFTTGPHLLHTPIVMTAGFGALIATGLACAERKVPHKNADADNAPLANDTKRQ